MPLTLLVRAESHASEENESGVMPNEAEMLPTPLELAAQHPLSAVAREGVRAARAALRAILRRKDDRFLVVAGPCSIHDLDSALEYAGRLRRLQIDLGDRILLAMRVYLEKPRTTTGWRGLINDPYLDGSFDMAEGLRRGRELLVAVAEQGVPAVTEMLDVNVAPYIADLIGFAAIGARTTESQPHRALASGLGMPVGFKNGTDGGLQTALDAVVSAGRPHSYVGIGPNGRAATVRTSGNPDCALILRGGKVCGPNHRAGDVAAAEEKLRGLESGYPPAILVDCSHANSGYRPERQAEVCADVAAQRAAAGARSALRGIMLESHLEGGKQPLRGDGTDKLQRGVSVTDPCLSWPETEALLRELYRQSG